jgi:phage terminase Nu1 subunit (DNA packaging protein)
MNQPKQEEGSALYEAQRRRTVAQAIREEMENQVRKGELVERGAVEKEWNKVGRQVRDALENIPARVAGLVAAEKSQDKCFQIIEREVRQALEGLANES